MFSPKVDELLERRRLKGNTHTVRPFNYRQKYEVQTPQYMQGNRIKGGRKHEVLLNVPGGKCSCQKPQLTGIPCSHLLAACANVGVDSNQYVVPWHKMEHYSATWSPNFAPFGNPDTWPRHEGPTLIPDAQMYVVKKGRRQKIRIRTGMDAEDTHRYTCGRCGQNGHVRRSCRTVMPN